MKFKQNLEHLSWLGLFKDTRFYAIGNSLIPDKNIKREKLMPLYEKFKKYALIKVTDETRQYLKQVAFDNWKFDDAEMLVLLQQMFIDLQLTKKFAIKIETLQQYLFEIYVNYNDVPFHNFRHAFTVTQMVSFESDLIN
jgi:high affinity cGMP-specific 3',5'-cyclic phosphodiesterase 9